MEELIRVSSHQEWREWEKKYRAKYADSVVKKEEQRESTLSKFPYSVVVEGYCGCSDLISRWLWQTIGPRDGMCWDYCSEYPGCPQVLATRTDKPYECKDKDGNVVKKTYPSYSNSGDHSHEGKWTCFVLNKSDYDFFYMEFFFESEEHANKFKEQVPIVNKQELPEE